MAKFILEINGQHLYTVEANSAEDADFLMSIGQYTAVLDLSVTPLTNHSVSYIATKALQDRIDEQDDRFTQYEPSIGSAQEG